VFGNFSGHFAFYLTLVPITLVLITLYFFRRQVERGGEALAPGSSKMAG